mgnify:CR=1 FL=1
MVTVKNPILMGFYPDLPFAERERIIISSIQVLCMHRECRSFTAEISHIGSRSVIF